MLGVKNGYAGRWRLNYLKKVEAQQALSLTSLMTDRCPWCGQPARM